MKPYENTEWLERPPTPTNDPNIKIFHVGLGTRYYPLRTAKVEGVYYEMDHINSRLNIYDKDYALLERYPLREVHHLAIEYKHLFEVEEIWSPGYYGSPLSHTHIGTEYWDISVEVKYSQTGALYYATSAKHPGHTIMARSRKVAILALLDSIEEEMRKYESKSLRD